MGRTNLEPPKDPAALAALLNGQAPAVKPSKTPTSQKGSKKLRPGRMGDPCVTQLPGGKGRCKGKLSDFSRVRLTKLKITRITLQCPLCRVVQAVCDVSDLS
ncbi:MAG: hypothetical protein V4719_20420 [Planctomycetota bacterium]